MTIKKFVHYSIIYSLLTSLLPATIQAITWEEYVKKNGIPEVKNGQLNLDHKSLEVINFRQIKNIESVKKLYLFNNQLTTLPPEIGNLEQLREIVLSLNKLTSLPPEIGKLKKLQELSLSNNYLTTLPPGIGNLTQLQKLSFSENQLTSLPPEIGNLTQLQELSLFDNQFTALPPTFAKLNHSRLRLNEDKSQQLQQNYTQNLTHFILQAIRTNNLVNVRKFTRSIIERCELDPNDFYDEHGNNLLHLAIWQRNPELDPEWKMVKEFIAAGVDLAAKNNNNQTPLELWLGTDYDNFLETIGTLLSNQKKEEFVRRPQKRRKIS